jgi:colanic acid biosynthesis glycosyl transferase WcaI
VNSRLSGRRPRLLVLNQYYKPGVEATANLLAELCEALTADYDVTVVTGRLLPYPDLPSEEMLDGVHVVRTRSTAYDRSHLDRRAANYLSYLGDSLLRAMRSRRPDLVLCMTDPPIVGNLGLVVARRFGVPLLVISQDVFPEIATELGRLKNRSLVRILRALVRSYLERADQVVAIGERMRERLIDKGAHPDRVAVIPNWVDTRTIFPLARNNQWTAEQELQAKFVVMHSGNIGHAQNLDTLLLASTYLRDLDDLAVMVVGFGARIGEVVARAETLQADAVRFLHFQPRERLAESLSSAQLHYVGLAKGLAGYVVPSRMYGILAAGRPVLVAADSDSETARLVTEVGCGVSVPPDRPDLVAAAIRDAHAGRLDLEAMGRAGRAYVEREADREVALERYRSLISEMLGTSGSRRI